MTVTGNRTLAGWKEAAVLVTAVAVNASDYSFLVPLQQLRIDTHRSIIEGQAPAPRQHQILVPYILEPPIRLLAEVMPPDKALTRVYAAYHLAALTLLLATLFVYLGVWFSAAQALAGALVVGSAIRIVLRPGEYWDMSSIPASSVFAPASLLEPAFIALGLLLIHADRRWLLAGLIAIAAANSDAAALLPVLFVVTRPLIGDRIAAALGYLAIGAAVSIAVRLSSGGAAFPPEIGQALTENLQHLPSLAINLALFLGLFCLLIPFGWRRTPEFARRAMFAVPLYLMAVAAWGYWWDVRNLAPLYPILLPPALAALFQPRGDSGLRPSWGSLAPIAPATRPYGRRGTRGFAPRRELATLGVGPRLPPARYRASADRRPSQTCLARSTSHQTVLHSVTVHQAVERRRHLSHFPLKVLISCGSRYPSR